MPLPVFASKSGIAAGRTFVVAGYKFVVAEYSLDFQKWFAADGLKQL